MSTIEWNWKKYFRTTNWIVKFWDYIYLNLYKRHLAYTWVLYAVNIDSSWQKYWARNSFDLKDEKYHIFLLFSKANRQSSRTCIRVSREIPFSGYFFYVRPRLHESEKCQTFYLGKFSTYFEFCWLGKFCYDISFYHILTKKQQLKTILALKAFEDLENLEQEITAENKKTKIFFIGEACTIWKPIYWRMFYGVLHWIIKTFVECQ